MTKRQAVTILMLSPFYSRMTVKKRLELVKKYVRDYNAKDGICKVSNEQ